MRLLRALIISFSFIAILLHNVPVSAQERAEELVWIDAFQSSPADYRFSTSATLPDAYKEITAPPTVTGTVRLRFAVAATGKRFRIRLSNEESDTALLISRVTVGLAGEGFDARERSLRAVTFSGEKIVRMAGRAPSLSDPVDLPVTAGDELIVSIVVPGQLTMNQAGAKGMEVASGDQSLSPRMKDAKIMLGRPVVSGVLVETARPRSLIVALGDSITDGNKRTVEALRGWPEQLSRRIIAQGKSDHMVVVNAAISGNRVLSNGFGASALSRLDRDVLRLSGVTHLIVLEGINDIGLAGENPLLGGQPELDETQLIAGYRQIIARARAAGIKVFLGTIMPFKGAAYHTDDKELQRQFVNNWIRNSGEADGVIDFDTAMRDPDNPLMLLPAYHSGDHLHPSETGMIAMGTAIDLELFE